MTNGQTAWSPGVLNFAAMELMREFPNMQPERAVAAVAFAAQVIKPAAGNVALLQKARELLR